MHIRIPRTGPTCIQTCTSLPNGHYQWCGGCDVMISCVTQRAYYYRTDQPRYTVWDDNRKSFVEVGLSTTCSECYVECPAEHKIAPGVGES